MRIAQVVMALVGAGLLSACSFNADFGTGQPADRPSQQVTEQADAPDQPNPRTHGRVTSPEQAGRLVKLTGPDAISDVVLDPGEMRSDMTLVMENYRIPGRQGDPVLVVAVDNVPEDTGARRQHLWRGMLEYVGWTHGEVSAEPYAAGKHGGSVECFLASLAETGNVICGWADDGTAGVALFPDSDLLTASTTFVAMRDDIEI